MDNNKNILENYNHLYEAQMYIDKILQELFDRYSFEEDSITIQYDLITTALLCIHHARELARKFSLTKDNYPLYYYAEKIRTLQFHKEFTLDEKNSAKMEDFFHKLKDLSQLASIYKGMFESCSPERNLMEEIEKLEKALQKSYKENKKDK